MGTPGPNNFGPGLMSQAASGSTAIVAAQAVNALPWKRPVRVATTSNIAIATGLNAGDVVDGVTLAEGDRVLVWLNTAQEENGIITVGATPGRAIDFDSSDELVGSLIAVLEGTAHGGKLFRNTNTGVVVVDTDPITFEAWPPATVGAEGAMVPYFIAAGDTFTVPEFKQALFSMTIDNEGILDVVGYLLEVD